MNTGQTYYKKALIEARKQNPNKTQLESLLEAGIEHKEPQAMYALGSMLFHGHIFSRNRAKGITLFKKAADHGVADAIFELAVAYEKGVGVGQSDNLAFMCYNRAALQGDGQSYFEVGRCYYYGIGVGKNKQHSEIWFEKAEELGITYEQVDKQVTSSKLEFA